MTPVIEQSFAQYASAVAQSRALVDVRDCIKPSARQIFYSMLRNKYTWDKPFEKTNAPMGDALKDFYIHGTSSCVGIMMRACQSFSMRYPLCECKGNSGTMIASGNFAAERYTSTRLAPTCAYLFADIQKNTIDEWRDNYADNLQYPAVLPSKGFYNLVNGSMGIATGLASSIPQYNLKELNEVLIKLLWDKDAPDDEIVIMPDFATGAILLNQDQVRKSMLVGHGASCRLRSVVEYDAKERCLVVLEIPYGVYTNTICEQLEEILNGDENPGIERFNDLTDVKPKIKIYLAKGANPERVLRYLYKNTSLQYYYGINFTMLENGRFPRVYGWRELLLAHLAHEANVYRRGFEFDVRKINARLHIINGLLRAISMIDEVVRTIKNSKDTHSANLSLQNLLLIDEVQAKAILDIKLARLAHLEVDKLTKEKGDLEKEKSRIEQILSDENLLKKEIENGLREVANKFGDARRTKVMNLATKGEEEKEEIVEEKRIVVSLTNFGNLLTEETSTLVAQRRGGRGARLPLKDGEFVIDTLTDTNIGVLMLFTDKGRYYSCPMSQLEIGKSQSIYDIAKVQDNERITNIMSYAKAKDFKYIVFMTKQGVLKKSLLNEYKATNAKGAIGIKLKDGDELASIVFMNEEQIAVLSASGQFCRFETKATNPIGKNTTGVRGMKLNEGDEVVCARAIREGDKFIVAISENGLATKTKINECALTNRDVKGYKLQKLVDGDKMCSFVMIESDCELMAVAGKTAIKFKSDTVSAHSRGADGVKGIKPEGASKVSELVVG